MLPKLNSKQLRAVSPEEIKEQIKAIIRRPLFFILENIYDTYNVGGIFRLADALNAEKIFLCGQTEIPPNHKIKKASIGTDKIVNWEYCKTALDAITEIKKLTENKVSVIAVEQSPKSVPYTEMKYHLPLALVFGNETFGITPETLAIVDRSVIIPMYGINKSLNVIVAAAIVAYWADFQLQTG